MSQFEGYMGGTPGQGYQGSGNGGSTNQTNQRDTQLSSHTLGETQDSENYASLTQPYSMGSITQYYQPTILQSEAKSQFRTSNNPDSMIPNHANSSSSSILSHQVLPVEQNFRPHLSPNISQSTFPEHASNQVWNPISTKDFGNTSLNTQSESTTIVQQSSFVAGSYSARSAQAYSVSGGISTYKQESSMLPIQPTSVPVEKYNEPPAVQAQQNRILADCTRRVQEHAYFMKQAMDKDDLSNVLDRASQMVGELSDSASGSLSPKNYYELHMRALDDMPSLEEYFLNLAASDSNAFTMKDLYEFVQYCPKVLSRLYLQISAGSALIRSKEESATTVLHDLIEAVKCVQNPLRGLFLRHFLLQVTRDRLQDGDNAHIAYEFILSNFIEMNHLWVRIQFSPGDGKTKEQRKRRERERNELRILVGTNLVRLSQLEGVTSKIYGEIILPKILEQVTSCGDPLAQAYLIDCIIQVFPDEYHIETLAILLAVCPRLKDKVNIRTIIQSLMDRLSNYFADKELLDEIDSNNVKRSLIPDSFKMFETCVERVYEARGPKLVPREIIRLQTALFNFSLKCFPENMEQLSRCLEVCNRLIRQVIITPANTNQSLSEKKVSFNLDEASKVELENMLSTPLNLMSIKVLQLNHYSDLLEFLPLENRREVGMTMLRAIDSSGEAPLNLDEIEKLFNIVLPVVSDDKSEDSENSNIDGKDKDKVAHEENSLVSKLLHLLQQTCIDGTYDMLSLARSKLCGHCNIRNESILVPLVFEALQLANRILLGYHTAEGLIQETSTNSFSEGCVNALEVRSESEFPYSEINAEDNRKVNASNDTYHENIEETSLIPKVRKVLLFVQSTISIISKRNPELGVNLYLQASVAADSMFCHGNETKEIEFCCKIVSEFLTQAYLLMEDDIFDSKVQRRCLLQIIGSLLTIKSLSSKDYAAFATKTAQVAAKVVKRYEQCEMVALCSYLFFKQGTNGYCNPQRTLECLQRSIKLADTLTLSDPECVRLFVDLLESYVHFFEENNPVITEVFINGLITLTRENIESLKGLSGLNSRVSSDIHDHFSSVCLNIESKKRCHDTADRFANIITSIDN